MLNIRRGTLLRTGLAPSALLLEGCYPLSTSSQVIVHRLPVWRYCFGQKEDSKATITAEIDLKRPRASSLLYHAMPKFKEDLVTDL